MSCRIFSTQCCSNQLRVVHRGQLHLSTSPWELHPGTGTLAQAAGAGRGEGKAGWTLGAAGEPGMAQSPGAVHSSDSLSPELSLSYHV